MNLETKIERRW